MMLVVPLVDAFRKLLTPPSRCLFWETQFSRQTTRTQPSATYFDYERSKQILGACEKTGRATVCWKMMTTILLSSLRWMSGGRIYRVMEVKLDHVATFTPSGWRNYMIIVFSSSWKRRETSLSTMARKICCLLS